MLPTLDLYVPFLLMGTFFSPCSPLCLQFHTYLSAYTSLPKASPLSQTWTDTSLHTLTAPVTHSLAVILTMLVTVILRPSRP